MPWDSGRLPILDFFNPATCHGSAHRTFSFGFCFNAVAFLRVGLESGRSVDKGIVDKF